jgi:DNA polymerase
MEKEEQLRSLAADMAADRTLPLGDANLVFGEGDANAAVMFVGEAPGQNEDRLKRPFVGRGGQLLDRMIAAIGWRRGDVYITNIVKRRPPENRDPSPEEIAAYRPYLAQQIAIVNPKIIVTLGRFAMNYFLPMAKITRDRGRAFRVDGRIVVPVLHPAAALRSTEMMRAFEEDFGKLPAIVSGDIGTEVPPSVVTAPAREEKKPELPRTPGLF